MAEKFKACSVDGCNGNAHRDAGGRTTLCRTHSSRLYRYGKTDPLERESLRADWLRERVRHSDKTNCLVWPFGNGRGYGSVYNKSLQRTVLAHRYMCELAHGAPTPAYLQAAHSCGNSSCVNPNHLSWKTQSENEADKISHGRSNRGVLSASAKLTAEDVAAIRAANGVTQQELADQYGVSRGHIASLRNGRFWPELTPST